MLKATLFGGASFFIDGAIFKSDLGPSGRLLACYLIEFMGRVHRRERLADLFWSGADPDRARSSLNTAIWRIRKMLDLGSKGMGRRLITVGEDVVLEECLAMQVDTHQFESASKLMLSKPEGTHSPDDIEAVRAVVDVYAGPFLDGY